MNERGPQQSLLIKSRVDNRNDAEVWAGEVGNSLGG